MSEFIITGGRDYCDAKKLNSILFLLKPVKIIQGGASGADWLAKNWALEHRVLCVTIPAEWELHGKSAGPIRNLKMLNDFPDAIVLAFPGGKGTANCVSAAISMGRYVLEVK